MHAWMDILVYIHGWIDVEMYMDAWMDKYAHCFSIPLIGGCIGRYVYIHGYECA